MTFVSTAYIAKDEYWIEQYRLGNPEGMGILYQRYFPKVYNKCLSLCKDADQAFDLAQDILLKAFDRLHTFCGKSAFATWLYALTYNHYLEFFRKSKRLVVSRLQEYDPIDEQDWDADFLEAGDKDSNQLNMLTLLNKLPDEEKTMLLLKYRDGESIEQLKAQFNLSAGAIKMRLKRARAKLNQLYSVSLAWPDRPSTPRRVHQRYSTQKKISRKL
jgi:RNA polymerase sigma-70 factor (ECF subfamily)